MLATKRLRIRLLASLCALSIGVLSGCGGSKTVTSAQQATGKPATAPRPDSATAEITNILRWLNLSSQQARSMKSTGSVSLEQDGDGQSAQFSIRSVRLGLGPGTSDQALRVDSLSMEVVGPFGIKVAKFLASPAHYYFYNALQGETDDGATDAYSLERLTQLKGVTLKTMSDVLYGLAPNSDAIAPQDSLSLQSKGDHHSLVIHRADTHITELLAFSGTLPSGENTPSRNFSLRAYTRWNRDVNPLAAPPKPDVIVHYGPVTIHNGVPIPATIEATAGANKLTLEYSDISANPSSLTVFIKVPRK